jgi:hypothetical protein
MNWHQTATPEQKEAAIRKMVETRRVNKEAVKKARQDALTCANGLGKKIAALEKELGMRQLVKTFNYPHLQLTSKRLLLPHEIIESATPWLRQIGIYFLINANEIVYVGQSVNIFARASQHFKEKKFTHFAYINCLEHQLDKLESIYIHFLQPVGNGFASRKEKIAPLKFVDLIN